MTAEQDDLSLRPIAGREELALRGDRLLARLGWWGQAGDGAPFLLDFFDIDDDSGDWDRVDIGVRLLEAAMAEVVPAGTRPPEYIRIVPSD